MPYRTQQQSQSSIDLSSNRKLSSAQTQPTTHHMYSGVSQDSKYGATVTTSGKNLFECFKGSSVKKLADENFNALNSIESVRANIVPSFDAVAKDKVRNGFATVDYSDHLQSFETSKREIKE